MAETLTLVDPKQIDKNPENPRLIFHEDELLALQESIQHQGILVPLTVYKDGVRFVLLDGERRWRCALKLGLKKVPTIIQPKPDKIQNIMMMFAVHNARRDWDPLPTAYKLKELEDLLTTRQGKRPTEREIAEAASISPGEVRRLKKLLGLPQKYRDELMEELKKPRSKQLITVDHVLEVTRAAFALRKRAVVTEAEEDDLRSALLGKFRAGVVQNTVAPRKLARVARAVERGEIAVDDAREVVKKLMREPSFSIDAAFEQSVAQVDFQHGLSQLVSRLQDQLEEHKRRGYRLSPPLRESLEALAQLIRKLLG
ncbi:MAG TPA: ParB/RepB/Spo0J family partition protein [Planctomycetota bacterium]|nr:ParB/RepB/Spo0J family partition protein [Planctomycetota bacterium]